MAGPGLILVFFLNGLVTLFAGAAYAELGSCFPGAIVTGAFLVAFGALALCFVLAFVLGSKRAIELMWEERFRRRKERREKDAEPPKGK